MADIIAELQIRCDVGGDIRPSMERLYIRKKTSDPALCRCRRCRKLFRFTIPDVLIRDPHLAQTIIGLALRPYQRARSPILTDLTGRRGLDAFGERR